MAILIMAGEEENPTFHDFFGMSCTESAAVPPKKAGFLRESRVPEASASVGASSGAHGPVSASSDLGSERQAGNNPDGVQFQGSMSDLSGPEMSKGRKRSNSDLAFMGSVRDRIHHVGPDSLESVHLLKMFPKEAGGERPRSHGDELAFAMQPPRSNSTAPLLLQPPISSRPELVVSSWDRSVPMNVGPAAHHPSRLGQLATYVDKFSSNRYKDGSPSTSLITQPAADEGSRTGIKGSGILNVTNATSRAAERNMTGVLLNSSKPKAVPLNNEIETSSLLSRHSSTPTSRQMTIFYDGQAHVFDDVHPTKADAIMALAGSSGGSWSTNYLSRSSVRPPLSEAYVPNRENEMGTKDIALSQDIQGRLSTLGTSNGSSHGGRISYLGAHQGLRQTRDTRTVAQASDPNTEGKREV
ncbi:protein TIFY 8-like protein [Cinnamomum micranthum f. kanehirae]|uniref:Protein TIFY n=1 Tax=Cinnamomum micranthum f. kanehirae TaxID=337451 RepID=A0A443NG03_9MAGN|nr:protein TIFY 8-like protein [Cinnamomum micranthum f. kanehirae]